MPESIPMINPAIIPRIEYKISAYNPYVYAMDTKARITASGAGKKMSFPTAEETAYQIINHMDIHAIVVIIFLAFIL